MSDRTDGMRRDEMNLVECCELDQDHLLASGAQNEVANLFRSILVAMANNASVGSVFVLAR